jgi:ATP-dependent RNA helicase UAP56/SUB2
MSSHDNDELIDYEDENDVVPNGAIAASGGATADDDKDKKNFSGIHSTGFRSASESSFAYYCVDNYKAIFC